MSTTKEPIGDDFAEAVEFKSDGSRLDFYQRYPVCSIPELDATTDPEHQRDWRW